MEECVRLMFESMLQKQYKNINGLERVDHIMLDFQRNEKNEHELNNEYIKKNTEPSIKNVITKKIRLF